MSNNKCGLFHELYNTEPNTRSCFNNSFSHGRSTSCFGNEQVGKEYICPKINRGIIQEQPLSNWFQAQQCNRGSGGAYPCNMDKDNPMIRIGQVYPGQMSQNIGINSICGRPEANSYVNSNRLVKDLANPQIGGGDSPCFNNNCYCDNGYCRESYGPDYFNLAALGLEGQMQLNAQQAALQALKMNSPQSMNNAMPVTVKPKQQTGGCDCNRASRRLRDKAYPNRISDMSTIKMVDGCPEFSSMSAPPIATKEFVCGNRIRCGNGSPTTKLPDTGCDCDCTQVLPKIWDQPINVNRTYGFTQAEQVPGFYLDVSQPPIASRPVVAHSNREDIPSMLLVNNINLPNRDFGCKQPCWNANCL